MPFEKLIAFLPLIFFIFLLFASFFLNYISSLYSEADLFKIDLTKERKKRKFKKLVFVLKNGHLLFAVISFLQVILNMFISIMSLERIDERLFLRINKFVFVLMMGLFIALFTEIFSRYLGTRQFSKKLIQNNFFIDFSYSLIRIPFALLHKIVRPKKKLFVNSEIDVIRFINNLAAENILEKQEARLVQSAFNFDELRVNSVFTPWKKVIFLNESMSYEEIQKIYLQHFFTRYPVLNKKKEVIGIFNLETFYWALIKDKNAIWQNQIDKKLIFVSPDEKLDKVFEKLQLNYCHLAIVKINKRLLGIITLQNILNSLVGKMSDEKDRLLPRRLN
jgi:putative hemolysin